MSFSVLIVDDSKTIRSVVRRAIGMSGVDLREVFEAGNGHEALEVLRASAVDIVLCDLHMPEMSGMELVAAMSGDVKLRAIPVVIVSSDRSEVRMEEMKAKGVRGYLTKPSRPEAFRDIVSEVLGIDKVSHVS
ncbi:MAG: response regulator [Myxococcota bacterium]